MIGLGWELVPMSPLPTTSTCDDDAKILDLFIYLKDFYIQNYLMSNRSRVLNVITLYYNRVTKSARANQSIYD